MSYLQSLRTKKLNEQQQAESDYRRLCGTLADNADAELNAADARRFVAVLTTLGIAPESVEADVEALREARRLEALANQHDTLTAENRAAVLALRTHDAERAQAIQSLDAKHEELQKDKNRIWTRLEQADAAGRALSDLHQKFPRIFA